MEFFNELPQASSPANRGHGPGGGGVLGVENRAEGVDPDNASEHPANDHAVPHPRDSNALLLNLNPVCRNSAIGSFPSHVQDPSPLK
jgi:hypothetical protein